MNPAAWAGALVLAAGAGRSASLRKKEKKELIFLSPFPPVSRRRSAGGCESTRIKFHRGLIKA